MEFHFLFVLFDVGSLQVKHLKTTPSTAYGEWREVKISCWMKNWALPTWSKKKFKWLHTLWKYLGFFFFLLKCICVFLEGRERCSWIDYKLSLYSLVLLECCMVNFLPLNGTFWCIPEGVLFVRRMGQFTRGDLGWSLEVLKDMQYLGSSAAWSG